jgi:hypothetical protein
MLSKRSGGTYWFYSSSSSARFLSANVPRNYLKDQYDIFHSPRNVLLDHTNANRAVNKRWTNVLLAVNERRTNSDKYSIICLIRILCNPDFCLFRPKKISPMHFFNRRIAKNSVQSGYCLLRTPAGRIGPNYLWLTVIIFSNLAITLPESVVYTTDGALHILRQATLDPTTHN